MGRLPLWARLRSDELVVLKVEKNKRHELGVHIGQQSRLDIVSLTYSIPFAVAAATIEVVPLRASRDVFGAPVNAFAGLKIVPEVRHCRSILLRCPLWVLYQISKDNRDHPPFETERKIAVMVEKLY